LAFIGPNANKTSELAHLVIPSAVYAEKDGTFTNFQGRVQRLHAAFDPAGDSKPEWAIPTELAARLGVALSYSDAQAVFADLAKTERSFQGLSYETIGDQGALIDGH
ncbi:MAG: molybdopterin-dependent oxidoreductase, partial [Candidatus Eisenbacteria bacterium]